IVAKGSHPTPFELLQSFPSTALRQRDHSAGEKRCPKTHAMHCDVFGHVHPFMSHSLSAHAVPLTVGLGAKDFVARSLQRRLPDAGAPESPADQEDARSQIHHT